MIQIFVHIVFQVTSSFVEGNTLVYETGKCLIESFIRLLSLLQSVLWQVEERSQFKRTLQRAVQWPLFVDFLQSNLIVFTLIILETCKACQSIVR